MKTTYKHSNKTVEFIEEPEQFDQSVVVHFTDGTSAAYTTCSCCGLWPDDEEE